MREDASYASFQASEMYCPRCRASQPVRQKLLLILPAGNKYDYLCATCGTSVGSRMDDDRAAFSILGRERQP
ncbi:MAG: hypothetical protein ACE5HD_01090 [Acidobacteriota bacterium]